MIYCLDTSAINALFCDKLRQQLVREFLRDAVFYPTAYNVIEITGNSDPLLRIQLLSFVQRLNCHDYRPLAQPRELLERFALAFEHAKHRGSASAKDDGTWEILIDPHIATDFEQAESHEYTNELERTFTENY